MVRSKPRLRKRLTAALLLGILGIGGVPAAAAGVTSSPSPEVSGVALSLSSLSPTLLTPGSTLSIKGVLRNESPEELTSVSIRLRAIGPRLGTRADVARWLDGLDLREGAPVGESVELNSIDRMGQAEFSLSVPAAALNLPGPEFGTFPIAVEARAKVGELTTVSFVRTTVAAQRIKTYFPQKVSWLVPLTGLPGTTIDPASKPEEVLAKIAYEVGPGSRLRAMLDLAIIPQVSWAVDPQLILALETALSSTESAAAAISPSTAATKTPATASVAPPETKPSPRSSPRQTKLAADRKLVADFYQEIREKAPAHEVIALPYADPDLELLHSADQISLLPSHHAAGETIIESALDVRTNTELAWPTGSASDGLLTVLSTFGYKGAILDSRTRPLAAALDFTADARTTDLPAGMAGLLSDASLAQLSTSADRNDVAAQSRFLAETAAMTTERPGLPRRLLIALPRNAQFAPEAVAGVIRAGSQAPWLETSGISQVSLAQSGRSNTAELEREVRQLPQTRPPLSNIQETVALRSQLSALGQVLQRPGETTATLQRRTLELTSEGWRGRQPAWQTEYRRQLSQVSMLTGKVTVIPTNITFLRKSGEMRLTVANDSDQQVTGVRLKVVSGDRRLVVDTAESKPLTLGAGTRASVRVPVTALASGEVDLSAELISPSGSRIGLAKSVRMRVRPTDSLAISIGGVIAALVLSIGLFRTMRRQRSRSKNGE